MKKQLADYRRKAGFNTQEKLCKVLGVKRATISKWEIGIRFPRPSMLMKLATTLNTSEREIIAAIKAAVE